MSQLASHFEKRSDAAAAPHSAAALAIGYLGKSTDHWENIRLLLDSAGVPLVPVNDSTMSPNYKAVPRALKWKPAATLWRKSVRIRGQLTGTRDPYFVNNTLRLIDEHELDCVVAYWGAAMLGDLMAIKRRRPKVKLVLNLLCHPLGITPTKVALQNWYFRRAVNSLDGLIVSSDAMKTYLDDHIFRGRRIECLKWPAYYSRHFFPVERQPACPHVPNLLFLGRMDYYRAQPSDDVRAFVDELLDAGVHVYHHAAAGNRPHPRRHTFEYLPLQKAEEFATAFDASLILYNLQACGRSERFDVTVPDRLIASVTAGIPIALPAAGYSASMEYLRAGGEYEAVIPFTTARELAGRLADRPAMARMNIVARERSLNYVGERHMQPFLEFLRRLVES